MMEAVESECSEGKRGTRREWARKLSTKQALRGREGSPVPNAAGGVEEEGEEDCKLAPGCGPQRSLASQKAAVWGGRHERSKVRRMGGETRERQGAQTPLRQSTIRGEEKQGDPWGGVGVKDFINFKLDDLVCLYANGVESAFTEGFLFPGTVPLIPSCFSLITRTLSLLSLLSSYFPGGKGCLSGS